MEDDLESEHLSNLTNTQKGALDEGVEKQCLGEAKIGGLNITGVELIFILKSTNYYFSYALILFGYFSLDLLN